VSARILKWEWETKVRELYAGQFVWVMNIQDANGAYLCEMRSGPLAGESRWFKEEEFLPAPKSQTGV
jgi:hypothetical protein